MFGRKAFLIQSAVAIIFFGSVLWCESPSVIGRAGAISNPKC